MLLLAAGDSMVEHENLNISAALQTGWDVKKHPHPLLLYQPLDEYGTTQIQATLQGDAVTTPLLPYAMKQKGSLMCMKMRASCLRHSDRNLFKTLVTVGRAKNNDIVFMFPSVSKIHAVFHQIDEEWFLEDRNSSNGTFINGIPVVSGEPRAVPDESILSFGHEVEAIFIQALTFKNMLEELTL